MPTTVIWASTRLTGTIALTILKLIMLGHYYKLIDSSFKARMHRISRPMARPAGFEPTHNRVKACRLYHLATGVYRRPGVSTLTQLSRSVWNRIKELR